MEGIIQTYKPIMPKKYQTPPLPLPFKAEYLKTNIPDLNIPFNWVLDIDSRCTSPHSLGIIMIVRINLDNLKNFLNIAN